MDAIPLSTQIPTAAAAEHTAIASTSSVGVLSNLPRVIVSFPVFTPALTIENIDMTMHSNNMTANPASISLLFVLHIPMYWTISGFDALVLSTAAVTST